MRTEALAVKELLLEARRTVEDQDASRQQAGRSATEQLSAVTSRDRQATKPEKTKVDAQKGAEGERGAKQHQRQASDDQSVVNVKKEVVTQKNKKGAEGERGAKQHQRQASDDQSVVNVKKEVVTQKNTERGTRREGSKGQRRRGGYHS